jgi:ABC-type multidrug transport system ATPase subunit
MELLKELAMDNRLVVTSIHQPREEIFQMFTHVMLFYEGRMLFLGTQPQLKAFFTLHGLVVPKGMSSADYMGECHNRMHVSGYVVSCVSQR